MDINEQHIKEDLTGGKESTDTKRRNIRRYFRYYYSLLTQGRIGLAGLLPARPNKIQPCIHTTSEMECIKRSIFLVPGLFLSHKPR